MQVNREVNGTIGIYSNDNILVKVLFFYLTIVLLFACVYVYISHTHEENRTTK